MKLKKGFIIIKQTKTQQRAVTRSNNHLLTFTQNITQCLILSSKEEAIEILDEFLIWDKERGDYQPKGYFIIQEIFYDEKGTDIL